MMEEASVVVKILALALVSAQTDCFLSLLHIHKNITTILHFNPVKLDSIYAWTDLVYAKK